MNDEQHSRLVERLTTDAQPVRALQPIPTQLTWWSAAATLIVIGVVVANGRADLMRQLQAPSFVAHTLLLAVAGFTMAGLALASVVPGDEPPRWLEGVAWILTASTVLPVIALPANELTGSMAFARTGIPCALCVVTLAAVPWLLLIVALRRGAPFSAPAASTFAAVGAVLIGNLALRVECPLDERWHILAWHMTPVAVAAIICAAIGQSFWPRSHHATAPDDE